MAVSDLYIYPLKSARGIRLRESNLEPAGFVSDRGMLLVTPDGKFITQREVQALATLNVGIGDASVRFSMGERELICETPADSARRMDIEIWRSRVSAAVAPESVNQELSQWLDRDLRLVFFDREADRKASEEWAGPAAPVRFADGYPILVTTTASLTALNENMIAHGENAVTMDRFRPNIVIEHDGPWAEDGWATIEIAGIQLDLVKPCTRCIMTTQDQLTGARTGASPMPAMQRLRMSADPRVGGVLFGWNAVPRGAGKVAVGDEVRVLKHRPEGWALRQH